ncbi:MAG: magnesium chelatase domain-containing protein, partial [Ruminococcus sp.]|nr:magnesium chelatase domain-containing protein [Ruminococcus sp.]
MVVKTISFGINGIDGYLVEVEASSTRGMPKFDLVGLPDASVKESRDRVTSAMKNCGLQICSSHLTFNLAPADIRKEGPIYDLPITVCLMLLSGHIMKNTGDCGFIGELSLSGELRSVNGVLPMVIKARETGLKRVVVPPQNAKEAAVVDGIDVYTVRDIVELKRFLNGEK